MTTERKRKTSGGSERDDKRLLTDVEAAHHLGITHELIYATTQHGCGAEARMLSTVQREGRTYFDEEELENLDRYLRRPWVADGIDRPKRPGFGCAACREIPDSQLRDAKERNLEVNFEFAFTDGLATGGDGAERLTERLTRFASVAAYISAAMEGEGR